MVELSMRFKHALRPLIDLPNVVIVIFYALSGYVGAVLGRVLM